MVTNQGAALPYVGGQGEISVPLATDLTYRTPIPARPPKPRGLDWDAHTPTCPRCDQRSGQIDATGLCPACRGDIPVKAPTPAPVATIPTPAPAPKPRPTVRAKVARAGTHDVIITLRSTSDPIDQVKVAALLADLLAGLSQAPAPAPETPPVATGTRAGTKPAGRAPSPKRPAGTRPRKPRTPRADTFPIARAADLLQAGHTVPQIAAELGCAVSTARRHLTNAGHTIPDGRAIRSGGRNAKTIHDHNPDLVADITRRYTGGESTTQIGNTHDLSPKKVNTILRLAGIQLRPKANVGRTLTDDDITRAAELYTAGTGLSEVAKTLGVKKDRIREALTARGVTIRPHGGTRDSANVAGPISGEIRAWAQQHGLLDPNRSTGRLSRAVIDAYKAAHPDPTNTNNQQEKQ